MPIYTVSPPVRVLLSLIGSNWMAELTSRGSNEVQSAHCYSVQWHNFFGGSGTETPSEEAEQNQSPKKIQREVVAVILLNHSFTKRAANQFAAVHFAGY